MLRAEKEVKTPLTRQLDRLSRQILWVAGVALVTSTALNLARGDDFTTVFNAAVAFAIAAIPTGLPRGRDDDPGLRDKDAGRGRGDHEAAPVDRDPRLYLSDQLGQDRNTHAESDDRRPDGRRRPPVRHRGPGVLHRGQNDPRGRAGRDPARSVPAARRPSFRREHQ